MKVFVDTDADVRLARRLRRDISQRGRDLEGVLKQYSTMVQPAFYYYIAPLMVHTDIIVPRGGENEVAIELIVQHVHTQLQLVKRTVPPSIDYRRGVYLLLFLILEGFQTQRKISSFVHWSAIAIFSLPASRYTTN